MAVNIPEELRAFVLIVETGSLTQAADRMGIAVSAVSRRLRDLELRLGAALIQRSTRRLFLNETGQQFYERAKSILVTLEDAEQEVQNAGGALSGVLRVSAPLSFGIAHMSTAMAQFMHTHPEIHIEMDLSDKRVDMIAEGFDVAIRIGNLTDSSLIAKKISSKSNLIVKIGKQAFYKQLEMPLRKAYTYTSKMMTLNMMAMDAHEGISAFLEKRKPKWKNK